MKITSIVFGLIASEVQTMIKLRWGTRKMSQNYSNGNGKKWDCRLRTKVPCVSVFPLLKVSRHETETS